LEWYYIKGKRREIKIFGNKPKFVGKKTIFFAKIKFSGKNQIVRKKKSNFLEK